MKVDAGKLVTLSNPRSPAAEAYRTLRTSIQLSSLDSPLRTLLITSVGAGEGKSAILCNLAVTMAQAGTRTIVVDGDLRHPSIHQLLDLANDKGLATALLEQHRGELPLQPTAVPNLRALTAGPPPPNPADLLAMPGMQRVIESLSASAEVVLFGAPPVSLVADAALLASRLDAVILVVGAGKTRRDTATYARSILDKANARILGVVLGNVRPDPGLHSYCGSRGG